MGEDPPAADNRDWSPFLLVFTFCFGLLFLVGAGSLPTLAILAVPFLASFAATGIVPILRHGRARTILARSSAAFLILSPLACQAAVDRTSSGDARMFFIYVVPIVAAAVVGGAWAMIKSLAR